MIMRRYSHVFGKRERECLCHDHGVLATYLLQPNTSGDLLRRVLPEALYKEDISNNGQSVT